MSDEERDMTPATGEPASPAFGQRTGEGVKLQSDNWSDARWSYLYKDHDTDYGQREVPETVAEAAVRARTGPLGEVAPGMMKAPVWTWEVPLYFWTGGIASGSAFVALACDLAGDHRSARIARLVSLGALAPSPPLLVMDLGRPARFLNMLRIVKTRSPMSMGAWALTLFGNLIAGAVAADLLGRKKTARTLGAATALVGGYLGSYTGVLLASTAVPVWARSRTFLGPIFVCTATATGAAATRLVLIASGVERGHPTRVALRQVQAGAMAAELTLSMVNERRLGRHAAPLHQSRKMKWAKRLVHSGLGLQFLYGRTGRSEAGHAASVLYLIAGLLFRYAWVEAGPVSARDDRSVAEMSREKRPFPDGASPGSASSSSRP
jgi:formate-dependent nitrite reductase membrane component NrfD